MKFPHPPYYYRDTRFSRHDRGESYVNLKIISFRSYGKQSSKEAPMIESVIIDSDTFNLLVRASDQKAIPCLPANVLPPSLVVTTIVSAKRILLPLCDVILAQRTKKKGANLMLFLKSVKPEDGMKLKLIPVHLSSIQFHELRSRVLCSSLGLPLSKRKILFRVLVSKRAKKWNLGGRRTAQESSQELKQN